LLAQINQKLLKVFLVFALVVSMLVYPVLSIYGELDYNLSAVTFYTNKSEVISYSRSVPSRVYILLGILTVFTIYLLRLNYQKSSFRFLVPTLILILLVQPVKKVIAYGFNSKNVEAYIDVLPLKKTTYFFKELYNVKVDHEFVMRESSKPDSWIVKKAVDNDLPKTFVLVIGESVRKDFLNAYGFSQNNTPFISSSNRLQFDDYLAVAPYTIPSLLRTFSLTHDFPNYQRNNNLPKLAEKAGYETYWLSNQGQVGFSDTPIAAMAKSSMHYKFVKNGDSFAAGFSDFDLLPMFNEVLKEKTKRNRLIVVHMIGSHPSSCENTGGKFDEFFLSEDISCYIQSIKNMDNLLHNFHQSLERTGDSYKLVYFSDHGLMINDDLVMTHGRGIKQSYEVPLLIWGNDITTTKHFSARRYGNDFLHLFTELTGIESPQLKRTYRFVSDEDATNTGYLLDASEKQIKYDQLKDNQIKAFIK
jgi:Predicted membrane-associated, metal-dependent hydrolase